MAALDTATKAPLIVRTAAGVVVEANGTTLAFDPEGIVAVEGIVVVPDVGTCLYLAGIAPGSTVLTITGGGSTGTLPINVAAAPLVVGLGDAVPR